MRKRNHRVRFRLNDKELAYLNGMVQRTNLTREEFLRKMIAGYTIAEKPDIEYFEVIRQLRYIGNNLRQMAIRAHALYLIDADVFMRRTDEVIAITNQLAQAVGRHQPPKKRRKKKTEESSGGKKSMEEKKNHPEVNPDGYVAVPGECESEDVIEENEDE